MRLKRILIGLSAGAAIVTAAAFFPGKKAVADDGWDCYATKANGGDCGCPDCWLNNCTCPTKLPAA